jgi:macrolide-specific efflux system membrane fusion protein
VARIQLPDGRIEERELRAGVRNRISVEVQQGVQEGERIVIAEKPGRRGLRFQL